MSPLVVLLALVLAAGLLLVGVSVVVRAGAPGRLLRGAGHAGAILLVGGLIFGAWGWPVDEPASARAAMQPRVALAVPHGASPAARRVGDWHSFPSERAKPVRFGAFDGCFRYPRRPYFCFDPRRFPPGLDAGVLRMAAETGVGEPLGSCVGSGVDALLVTGAVGDVLVESLRPGETRQVRIADWVLLLSLETGADGAPVLRAEGLLGGSTRVQLGETSESASILFGLSFLRFRASARIRDDGSVRLSLYDVHLECS